jgi:YidC/Oxa1 family membrane protein insertase
MFETIIIAPLTNTLIGLTSLFWGNLGIAVITLTVIVKIILFPFSLASIKHQAALKKIQPLINEINKKYSDKNERALKTMELYKEHKANPFSGCLPILIQIPIIIGLYQVFSKGTALDPEILYSFITQPEIITTTFLGIELTAKSMIFAILAGITQYIQISRSPAFNQKKEHEKDSEKDQQALMMEGVQKMMKYMLPGMITVFALLSPGAVALYWIIINVFTIGQEYFVYKKLLQEKTI